MSRLPTWSAVVIMDDLMAAGYHDGCPLLSRSTTPFMWGVVIDVLNVT
jgi:hypothetical protein